MVATSQQVHEKIGRIQIKGVDAKDKVIVRRLDYTGEDHTLMLPLWAGVPDSQQAQVMISRTILNAERFDRPFGIPACPLVPNAEADSACLSVYLPWNLLICEGLLSYGFRKEAARLVAHMMAGVIQNLKAKTRFLPTLSRRNRARAWRAQCHQRAGPGRAVLASAGGAGAITHARAAGRGKSLPVACYDTIQRT